MSGLAEILLREGFTVTGSDAHETELTDHLEAAGAQIFYGQRAENISDNVKLVVIRRQFIRTIRSMRQLYRRGFPC